MAISRFKQLRVLWDVHFCVPQFFLSLTENNQFRTSQLREAAERQAVKKLHFHLKNKTYNSHNFVLSQANF
jgi:hypothetical protein